MRIHLLIFLFVAAISNVPSYVTTSAHAQVRPAMEDSKTAPIPSPSVDEFSQKERVAKLEKLNLEIAALKSPSSWYKPILDATPLIAVIVTVAGLWAGAYKYFEDKKSARASEQCQIRADFDQLVSFPTDNKVTLSRILFLFHDLRTLSTYDASFRDSVTDIVEKLVETDLDFEKLRDVNFEISAMEYWPEYTNRLATKGGSPQLRYKYYQAFRHLYDKDPSYFSSITYDAKTDRFIVKRFTQEVDFLLFGRLVEGYRRHVNFISNPTAQQEAKRMMAEATHNPDLVDRIFSRST
jgi:hypothetical protein